MPSSGENSKRVLPRGGLCGPRPRSLSLNARVGTDSSKIKIQKPGAADQRCLPPPPPPIVIHIRSPEIIHTRPQDFRALVQQLTGMASSSSHAHQKFGSISASVVDDCKCKACEILSTGDSVHQNDEAENFSSRDSVGEPHQDINDVEVMDAAVLAPIVPSSWPASPPSVSATSFLLPASPMITYPEWHEFGPIF